MEHTHACAARTIWSARMPFSPFWYRLIIHCTPFSWYDRISPPVMRGSRSSVGLVPEPPSPRAFLLAVPFPLARRLPPTPPSSPAPPSPSPPAAAAAAATPSMVSICSDRNFE